MVHPLSLRKNPSNHPHPTPPQSAPRRTVISIAFTRNSIIALLFLLAVLFVLSNFIKVLHQQELKTYTQLSLDYHNWLKEEQELLTQLDGLNAKSPATLAPTFLAHERFQYDWKKIKLYEIPIVVLNHEPETIPYNPPQDTSPSTTRSNPSYH